MKKAENYEEAKVIIKNSTSGIVSDHNKKALKLRVELITLIGIVGSVGAGIITEEPTAALNALPFYGAFALHSMLQYLLYLRNQKKINDGSFFDKYSEEEVIKMANEYADTYNSYASTIEKEGNKK